MTLQVDLNPEQELWLRQTAVRAGVDQRTAILEVLMPNSGNPKRNPDGGHRTRGGACEYCRTPLEYTPDPVVIDHNENVVFAN